MSKKARITICVDGSCTGGNPGNAKYRGMDLSTGEVLFEYHIPGLSTSNLAEYFAIVHAVKYVKDNNLFATIYSDSVIAIRWAKNAYVNTTLVKSEQTMVSNQLIKNSIKLLKSIDRKVLVNSIKKWDTFSFGEVPADFGNKNKYKKNHEILTKK